MFIFFQKNEVHLICSSIIKAPLYPRKIKIHRNKMAAWKCISPASMETTTIDPLIFCMFSEIFYTLHVEQGSYSL